MRTHVKVGGRGGGRPLVGQLRALGRSYGDDTGPRAIYFHHWFPALYMWRHHQVEAERTFDALFTAGWHGVRILTAVGWHDGFWRDREVAPVSFLTREGRRIDAWPDYDDVLEECLTACRDRGLKVHITSGDMGGTGTYETGIWRQAGMSAADAHQGHLRHVDRVAAAVNRVGAEVVALFEACNEAWQNGVAQVEDARELANRFSWLCPGVLVCTSDSGGGEEPGPIQTWAEGMDVATVHGNRDADNAARRAFNLVYERPVSVPIWQGEPTGPDGADPCVFAPIQDPRILFAIYMTHLLTGQATNWVSSGGLRHHDALDATWGFAEFPALARQIIPDDIGQWPHVSHGNRDDTPIGARSFAPEWSGPARADQVWDDHRVVCVVHGGVGPWELILRRAMQWRLYSCEGLVGEGAGELPWMDASMVSRVIVGTF